jgi:hypothetical protein
MGRHSTTEPADLDMSEVGDLIADLKGVKSRMGPAILTATRDSASYVRDKARANIKAQTRGIYTRKYPSSITWSKTKATSAYVSFDIGPVIRRKPLQGFLNYVLEYGTVHNAPKPHLNPALDTVDPKYVDRMGDAGEEAVLG